MKPAGGRGSAAVATDVAPDVRPPSKVGPTELGCRAVRRWGEHARSTDGSQFRESPWFLADLLTGHDP